MRLYLDDERAPEGWVQVRWPDEAIKLLLTDSYPPFDTGSTSLA